MFGSRRLQALVLGAVFLLPAACGLDEPELAETGEAEGEPLDDAESALTAGTFDCGRREDTGYRGGAPFPIGLVTVDGRPVEIDTANAFWVMREAAARAGVQVRIVSGFRTWAEQQYLYGCYIHCNCNGCTLAARPGHSNHQSGHALDLNTRDPGVLGWLNAHGAAHGFSRTVPSEPWHWEWWGGGPGGGPCGAVDEGGCTAERRSACGNYGCGCADGQCSGGFCDGTGCSAQQQTNCAAYGCGCVDGQCSGGFCDGNGCTAKRMRDCGNFGCGCVDMQCSGGYCEGSGCTPKRTRDCGNYGCGCVDMQCNGGFCAGTGCTAKATTDCGNYGCNCRDMSCHGGFCPPG